jgi:hypothetical protein
MVGNRTEARRRPTRMRQRRRHLGVALVLVAVMGLVACGGDEASPPQGISAPTLIRMGGDAKGAPLANAAASEMVGGDAGRMAPWWGVTEYQLDAALPTLDTPAGGWRYSGGIDLDREGVRRVAATFGLEGEPMELPPDWGSGWRLGPDDGSSPTLWFGADSLRWWSYSAPWPQFREVESVEGDPGQVKPAEMTPPVGVPDASAARQLAEGVFAQLGLDPAALEVEVYADEWGASVTAWQLLDGIRTGYATSVGFGENAAVTWAGGHLNTPERVSGFARIGTAQGFERLKTGAGQWWGGMARPMTGVAVDPPAGEEPPVVTVRIVAVKEAWWTLYDVDGTMWVLPAYAFVDDDGHEHVVPAVTDDLIEPVDTDPAPGEGDMSEPMPPEHMPTEPMPGEPDPALPAQFVGLTEVEAVAIAHELGLVVRVVERDGEQFPVTMDYRLDRVNFVVTDAVVTRAAMG